MSGVFHRVVGETDYRVKLSLLIAYSIAAFTNSVVLVGWLLISAVAALVLCRVDRSPYLRAIPMFVVVLMVFFGLAVAGDPTKAGVLAAGVAVARWMAVGGICIAFFVATRPYDIVAGLRWLRLPKTFCLAIGMGLRFLPVIFEETRRIIVAQRARGLGRERGLQRMKHLPRNLSALLVPLLVGVMVKLDDLWLAMRVRGVDVHRIGLERDLPPTLANLIGLGYALGLVVTGIVL